MDCNHGESYGIKNSKDKTGQYILERDDERNGEYGK